jgi:hypothetical protein
LKLSVLLAPLVAALVGTGCADPCVQLAERICGCEPTDVERRACRADRITGQSGRVETDEAEAAFCAEKLETCDCRAIDENDLEKCGFVPEGDAE